MINNDDNQIQEMLSSFVDGRLTTRQENELKRLLQHDVELAEQLARLKRQRQLLSAMPKQPAPDGIARAVLARLERNTLLEETVNVPSEAAGKRQLFARRLLASAAMVLLPVAVLSFVVFNIIAPSSSQPQEPVAGEIRNTGPVTEPAVEAGGGTVSMPSMALALGTDESIAVSDFIEKAIFSADLIDSAIPSRSGRQSSYRITCSKEKMLDFVSELPPLWGRCTSASLELFGGDNESLAVIDSVRADQMLALYKADSTDVLALAQDFARTGTNVAGIPDDLSIPSKPILTSGSKPPAFSSQSDSSEKITLIITVNPL